MKKKIIPYLHHCKQDLEMNEQIINKKTLKEDEDQGEMDIIFFVFLFSYTIYLSCIDFLYQDKNDKNSISKFHLIMSNLWAFFPIMQAQGLWLKILLILTCYFSITWHWTNIGLSLPNDTSFYRIFDAVFSIITIISYSLSWIPKCKQKQLKYKNNYWTNHCLGQPKETSEWRCRWTFNLVFNIITCIIFGVILYTTDGASGYYVQLICCWVFISIAVISALYQLFKGDMTIGKKYRKNFIFWAFLGISFGCISFIYKMKSDNLDENSLLNHSVWHTYVMSCAYSFSRASEYLEIY